MKITKLLLCLLLAISVLSCPRVRNTKKNKILIGLVTYTNTDTFVNHLADIIENAAVGRATMLRYSSDNDQNKQNEQVQALLAQGVQALILCLVNRNSASIIAEQARQRRVPVVFINKEPEESVIGSWDQLYYVGEPAAQAGYISVEIVEDYIKRHPAFDLNGDGIIQYVVLMGEPSHQTAVLRTRSYSNAFVELKSDGGLGGEELIRDTAIWERAMAKEKMTAMLNGFSGKIEAVLANNDEMALGAIDALKEAGYFTKGGPFMPVVGIDGIPAAIDAIEEGTLLGTVLNNAVDQGNDALAIALALINRMDPEPNLSVRLSNASRTSSGGRYVWVPCQKITRDNFRGFIKR